MDYITTKQAAKKWGISERRVQVLCAQGRIKGAMRLGWAWAIPIDAEKPSDKRYKKNEESKERKEKKERKVSRRAASDYMIEID
ncbi:MAG TPA: helix-turn-helix domain-containing protein [Clostridiales bacterium]|nr:helix-turn-helix domain-containing protein [Clostridiales bacterium]